MFHSLFTVSIFDINLLMFDMTLRRRTFPANVRVYIHKSEKLILCISDITCGTVSYSAILEPNGLGTPWQRMATLYPEWIPAPLS